jgi:hypothetical protein
VRERNKRAAVRQGGIRAGEGRAGVDGSRLASGGTYHVLVVRWREGRVGESEGVRLDSPRLGF